MEKERVNHYFQNRIKYKQPSKLKEDEDRTNGLEREYLYLYDTDSPKAGNVLSFSDVIIYAQKIKITKRQMKISKGDRVKQKEIKGKSDGRITKKSPKKPTKSENKISIKKVFEKVSNTVFSYIKNKIIEYVYFKDPDPLNPGIYLGPFHDRCEIILSKEIIRKYPNLFHRENALPDFPVSVYQKYAIYSLRELLYKQTQTDLYIILPKEDYVEEILQQMVAVIEEFKFVISDTFIFHHTMLQREYVEESTQQLYEETGIIVQNLELSERMEGTLNPINIKDCEKICLDFIGQDKEVLYLLKNISSKDHLNKNSISRNHLNNNPIYIAGNGHINAKFKRRLETQHIYVLQSLDGKLCMDRKMEIRKE